MITVKNRTLIIPNNDRYIATNYDNNVTELQFKIDNTTTNGVDITYLEFFLDIRYENGTADSFVLEKQTRDDYILLTTRLTNKHLKDHIGAALINLRAKDGKEVVRWASSMAAVYIEDTINTFGRVDFNGNLTIEGKITSIEQLENIFVNLKRQIAEATVKAKEATGEVSTATEKANQAITKANEAETNARSAIETANRANTTADTTLTEVRNMYRSTTEAAATAKERALEAQNAANSVLEYEKGLKERVSRGEFNGAKGDRGEKGDPGDRVIATKTVLGGVKIGENVNVTKDGTISVDLSGVQSLSTELAKDCKKLPNFVLKSEVSDVEGNGTAPSMTLFSKVITDIRNKLKSGGGSGGSGGFKPWVKSGQNTGLYAKVPMPSEYNELLIVIETLATGRYNQFQTPIKTIVLSKDMVENINQNWFSIDTFVKFGENLTDILPTFLWYELNSYDLILREADLLNNPKGPNPPNFENIRNDLGSYIQTTLYYR